MNNFQTWLAQHLFTPSELESYLLCPFRFYAESFLGLKELPESQPEMTPREIGTVLHRILEKFLSGADWSVNRLRETTRLHLDHYQEERLGLSLPLFRRQREKIERTLEAFFEREAPALQKKEDLVPEKVEWSFGNEKIPPLQIKDSNGKIIPIRGRIDRIDLDRKGKRFLVIDYKTGSQKVTGAAIERGEALQLPLYILAVQKLLLPDCEPIGGLLYHLSDMSLKEGILHTERIPEKLRPHPRSSSLIPPARWDRIFEKTTNAVVRIVDQIRGEAFSPTPDRCEATCPYRDVCRL